ALDGGRAGVADLEADVAQAGGGGALARQRHGGRVAIDPDDGAARADELAGDERHVADAAADVEDAHPGAEPGGDEELAGEVGEKGALAHEALVLGRRVSEEVGRSGHHGRGWSKRRASGVSVGEPEWAAPRVRNPRRRRATLLQELGD